MTKLCRKGLHDLTLPGAILTTGRCRECRRASNQHFETSAEGKAYRRAYKASERGRQVAQASQSRYAWTARGLLTAIRYDSTRRGGA